MTVPIEEWAYLAFSVSSLFLVTLYVRFFHVACTKNEILCMALSVLYAIFLMFLSGLHYSKFMNGRFFIVRFEDIDNGIEMKYKKKIQTILK